MDDVNINLKNLSKTDRIYFLYSKFPILILISLYIKNLLFTVFSNNKSYGMFLEYIALGLVVYAFMILFNRRIIFISVAVLIFNFIDTLLILSNQIYHQRFNDYISFYLFRMVGHLPFVWRDVWSMMHLEYLFYFADIFVFIFILKRKNIASFTSKNTKPLFSLISILISVLLIFIRFGILNQRLPDAYRFKYGSIMLMNSTAIHDYYICDIISTLMINQHKKPLSQVKPVLPTFTVNPNETISKTLGKSAKGLNVIIIQCESLGKDLIDYKIDGQEVTPNLNKLVHSSLYYNFFISQSLTGSTSDAEFSTLTSLYTNQRIVSTLSYAKYAPFSLPKFLKQKNYTSIFFHANDGFFYDRMRVMPALGFDSLYFADYYRSYKREHMGTDDIPFFLESVKVLKEQKQPFLAYFVTISGHSPYIYPASAKPRLKITTNTFSNLVKDYLQVSNYVDSSLGIFLKELKKASLLDNSVLIIFGDHPPPLIPPLYEADAEHVLPSEVENVLYYRVPFIISWPKLKKPSILNTPASHVDITPTILSILGIKRPVVLLGSNLVNKDSNGFVLINSTPTILIRDKSFYWGYLQEGFKNYYSSSLKENFKDANQYLNLIFYSDYILKQNKYGNGL